MRCLHSLLLLSFPLNQLQLWSSSLLAAEAYFYTKCFGLFLFLAFTGTRMCMRTCVHACVHKHVQPLHGESHCELQAATAFCLAMVRHRHHSSCPCRLLLIIHACSFAPPHSPECTRNAICVRTRFGLRCLSPAEQVTGCIVKVVPAPVSALVSLTAQYCS